MNRFKEVTALFGLELGEKFNARFKSGEEVAFCPLKFNDDGLTDCNGVMAIALLIGLIKGDVIVEKLPWKPKRGDEYFYVDQRGEIMDEIYDDTLFDIMCFKLGNCFKTKEDAERNKDKIMNMLEE